MRALYHKARRAVAALALAVIPAASLAQVPPSLIADKVTLNGQILTATGNVTAFFDGSRLQASAIRYDGASDTMQLTGPILITTESGAILTADSATLDPRLRAGLLIGARLVLDQRLQLAAAQIDRSEGRYSRLAQVAATSCNVCAGKAPLWDIRAKTVIHDEVQRQLWFEGAQVRIKGTPIAYVPRLRLPDPSVTRWRGWLLPRVVSSDTQGLGVQLPYFIPMGDHRDLTLTPLLATKAQGLGYEYRQAFRNGDIRLRGALTRDRSRSDTRAWVFGELALELQRGYRLTADLELASDDWVLRGYDITDKDRLDSRIALTRIRADELTNLRLTAYHTQRASEDNLTEPTLLAYGTREYRIPLADGRLRFGISGDAHRRRESTPGPDARDRARLTAFARWDRRWIAGGMTVDAALSADSSLHYTWQDDSYQDHLSQTRGAAVVTLAYPMERQGRWTHRLTPQVTLGWSGQSAGSLANEDSTRNEFDSTSLTALHRYVGEDGPAEGAFASARLTWAATAPSGLETRLTIGRLVRDIAADEFSGSSGLYGPTSAWLIEGDLTAPNGLYALSRTIADNATVLRSETRLGWQTDALNLSATHVFLAADLLEERTKDVSEWTLDGSWQIDDTWQISARTRYDIAAGKARDARFGVDWRNECARLGLSVSHRFAGAANIPESTTFGLQVAIDGFSANPRRPRARSCPK